MKMQNKVGLQTWFAVLLFVLLLAMPALALAQEEGGATPAQGEQTVAEENEAPEGVGVLMLIFGLGGVTLVGGAMIRRDLFASAEQKQSA